MRHYTGEPALAEQFYASLEHELGASKALPREYDALGKTAAMFGLMPGKKYGFIWFIQRGSTCLDIGYKGILELAYRSHLASAVAEVVYDSDDFEVSLGTRREIKHIPHYANRKEIVAAYCVWQTKDGITDFCVLPKAEIERHRDASQAYQYALKNDKDNIWISWPEAMTKKVTVVVASKFWRLSPALAEAVSLIESDLIAPTATPEPIPTAKPEPTATAKPAYPSERFADSLPKWQALINDGKRTAQDILDLLSERYTPTDEQVNTILSLTPNKGDVI